jgi:hypothetical protein
MNYLIFTEESIRCVRLNFRKLLEEFAKVERRQIAFNHLKMHMFMHFNGLPKENHLVKTGLRREKSGCDHILKFLEWIHNGFLSRITQRLQDRKQKGKKAFCKEVSEGSFLSALYS